MPPKVWVEYAGAIYHVMSRGDRCEDIFLDNVRIMDLFLSGTSRAILSAPSIRSCREPGGVKAPLRVEVRKKSWGKVLRFPWCYDVRAVRQVEYNVNWLRKYLGVYAPETLLIQPVIVVPGWFVPPTVGNHPVKVMNATYLADYLKDADRKGGSPIARIPAEKLSSFFQALRGGGSSQSHQRQV